MPPRCAGCAAPLCRLCRPAVPAVPPRSLCQMRPPDVPAVSPQCAGCAAPLCRLCRTALINTSYHHHTNIHHNTSHPNQHNTYHYRHQTHITTLNRTHPNHLSHQHVNNNISLITFRSNLGSIQSQTPVSERITQLLHPTAPDGAFAGKAPPLRACGPAIFAAPGEHERITNNGARSHRR